MLHEPREDVADAALAGLVAVEAGDDAAVHDAAHARHFGEAIAEQHVARRRAHDGDQPSRLDDACRRHRDVRVDVGDGDRDPRRQAHPAGRFGGQIAGAAAERRQRGRQLRRDEIGEAGVERAEVVGRRVGAVLEVGLVAGGAGVARLDAAHPPDHPVGGLDQPIGGAIDLRRLFEDLQRLGQEPLARDLAAVAGEPRLAARGGGRGDAIGLRLRRVVLPQLDPRVRVPAELGQRHQRRAVAFHRQHRAGGEVDGDAGHGARIDARLAHRLGHGGLQHVQVVERVLQRPLVAQPHRRAGKRLIDHAVRVRRHRRGQFGAVADADDDRTAGFRAEVDPDRERLGHQRWRGVGAAPGARPVRRGDACGRRSGTTVTPDVNTKGYFEPLGKRISIRPALQPARGAAIAVSQTPGATGSSGVLCQTGPRVSRRKSRAAGLVARHAVTLVGAVLERTRMRPSLPASQVTSGRGVPVRIAP